VYGAQSLRLSFLELFLGSRLPFFQSQTLPHEKRNSKRQLIRSSPPDPTTPIKHSPIFFLDKRASAWILPHLPPTTSISPQSTTCNSSEMSSRYNSRGTL
jgi:hypothetical protein